MSKPPSPQTEIRNLRREINSLRNDVAQWKANATTYSQRALTAESEVDEWRRRFDALLKIVPEKK